MLEQADGFRERKVGNLVRTSPEETAALADLAADGGAFVSITTPGPDDARRGVRTVRVFARSDAAQRAEPFGLSQRTDGSCATSVRTCSGCLATRASALTAPPLPAKMSTDHGRRGHGTR